MHPAICAFPSRYFYASRLTCHPSVTDTTHAAPCHSAPALGPLVMWDVRGREARGGGAGGSMCNTTEAATVAALLCSLNSAYPNHGMRVLVATPYQGQARALREAMEGAGVEGVEVATGEGGACMHAGCVCVCVCVMDEAHMSCRCCVCALS